jgi:hypothetical protein
VVWVLPGPSRRRAFEDAFAPTDVDAGEEDTDADNNDNDDDSDNDDDDELLASGRGSDPCSDNEDLPKIK